MQPSLRHGDPNQCKEVQIIHLRIFWKFRLSCNLSGRGPERLNFNQFPSEVDVAMCWSHSRQPCVRGQLAQWLSHCSLHVRIQRVVPASDPSILELNLLTRRLPWTHIHCPFYTPTSPNLNLSICLNRMHYSQWLTLPLVNVINANRKIYRPVLYTSDFSLTRICVLLKYSSLFPSILLVGKLRLREPVTSYFVIVQHNSYSQYPVFSYNSRVKAMEVHLGCSCLTYTQLLEQRKQWDLEMLHLGFWAQCHHCGC
jgi:hypothetical protein